MDHRAAAMSAPFEIVVSFSAITCLTLFGKVISSHPSVTERRARRPSFPVIKLWRASPLHLSFLPPIVRNVAGDARDHDGWRGGRLHEGSQADAARRRDVRDRRLEHAHWPGSSAGDDARSRRT